MHASIKPPIAIIKTVTGGGDDAGTAAIDATARARDPPRPQTRVSRDRPATDRYYPTHPANASTALVCFDSVIYGTTIGDNTPLPLSFPLLLPSLPLGALHAASTYCAPGDWVSLASASRAWRGIGREMFERAWRHAGRGAAEVGGAWVSARFLWRGGRDRGRQFS